MRVPYTLTLTYSGVCAADDCDEEWGEEIVVPAGVDWPYPQMGHGKSGHANWNLVQGKLYCPNHILTVYSDGSVGFDPVPEAQTPAQTPTSTFSNAVGVAQQFSLKTLQDAIDKFEKLSNP